MQGGFVVGPTPDPSNSYEPYAILISSVEGSCPRVAWGTASNAVAGVDGTAFNINCDGEVFTVDQSGNIGVLGKVELQSSGAFVLNQTSTSETACSIIENNTAGFQVAAASGSCPFMLQSGVTQNKGQLTCTLSTLVCTQTATVILGAICTASYDTAATTVTAALLLPLTVKVVTTTLTISMQGAATATGTAAADYLCL